MVHTVHDVAAENQLKPVLKTFKTINLTFISNFTDKTEFQVSLLRGVKRSITFCKGSFNSSYQLFMFDDSYIKCTGIPTESNITFQLSGLNENHTDIYFLKKEGMYPPPYTCHQDDSTVIHVKEEFFKANCSDPQSVWPLLVTIIVTGSYSVGITAALLCYILKKANKNRILQSEYINVVPRRPKSHQPYAQTPMYSQHR
ncbi:hypothetical protein GDO86_017100 [Hymenochirus boettgeri]|uniref:T-cell-specific surface glycoprotein CD28 n=1 Tax=Hymenochirus boettgeri TaxID=247094 RepID=A0A8T2IQI3_9PIPI|nr:hypothetical protein GDO86_017100 [Hymenochirus boettgeri]